MKTMTSISIASSWIQYGQRKPSVRLRLFCFPYAGGSASLYRGWSERLPAEVEVCPIQLPGRENRLLEKPFSQLQPLVEALGEALLSYLDEPYAFFGHSMGALISFELTRLLRREGCVRLPERLLVSARCAPHLPDADAPTYPTGCATSCQKEANRLHRSLHHDHRRLPASWIQVPR
jgi:medium-chain acyl-[acyl-carrier-protein] hydrolase